VETEAVPHKTNFMSIVTNIYALKGILEESFKAEGE
jgi:hypothetical protein